MTDSDTERRAVVVERDLPHPPERVWRALTEPVLIADWLMPNDFEPIPGRAFAFPADWGTVECTVLAVVPLEMLSYTWSSSGLESVVMWTLAPSDTGTTLRMEQSGFRPDQQAAYQGAKGGWSRFFGRLEQVLERIA